jgi:hypothetical protein
MKNQSFQLLPDTVMLKIIALESAIDHVGLVKAELQAASDAADVARNALAVAIEAYAKKQS